MQKQPIFRSKTWIRAVASLDECVLCGKIGVQAAHRNEGKGMGQKVDDCLTAALCHECHHDIDNGNKLDREERRYLMDRAIVLTVRELGRRGLIAARGVT